MSSLLFVLIAAQSYPVAESQLRYEDQLTSFLIVMAIFMIAAWQGAQWYEYRIGRVTSDAGLSGIERVL